MKEPTASSERAGCLLVPKSSPTRSRKRFTWLCALGPVVLLIVFITMAAHIRLSLGDWPDRSIRSFQEVPLRIHNWLFAVTILFNFFGAVHLIVTLMHYRELGFGLRQAISLVVLFFAGCFAFLLFIANASPRFVKWFID